MGKQKSSHLDPQTCCTKSPRRTPSKLTLFLGSQFSGQCSTYRPRLRRRMRAAPGITPTSRCTSLKRRHLQPPKQRPPLPPRLPRPWRQPRRHRAFRTGAAIDPWFTAKETETPVSLRSVVLSNISASSLSIWADVYPVAARGSVNRGLRHLRGPRGPDLCGSELEETEDLNQPHSRLQVVVVINYARHFQTE